MVWKRATRIALWRREKTANWSLVRPGPDPALVKPDTSRQRRKKTAREVETSFSSSVAFSTGSLNVFATAASSVGSSLFDDSRASTIEDTWNYKKEKFFYVWSHLA